jgi:hypothetical protein
VKLAEKLGIKQAALSRLKRRSDMHISKLCRLIAGMGGTMKIVARFPGRGPVSVNLFDAIGSDAVDSDALGSLVGAGVKERLPKKRKVASGKVKRRAGVSLKQAVESFPIEVSEEELSTLPELRRDVPPWRRLVDKAAKKATTKHKTARSKT